MRGLFVTGTDTGVGKTLIAGAMAAALRARGLRVAVIKPVETGCAVVDTKDATVDGIPGAAEPEALRALNRLRDLAGPAPISISTRTPAESLEPMDARQLIALSGCDAPLEWVNPYRYAPAVAPAVAAELAERPIDPAHILDCMARLAERADILIAEGAGGVMVPVSEDALIIDLIARSGLPALVVGRSALGTINHCLLTVDALTKRGVPVAGVVLNRLVKRPSPEEAANPQQIERFAGDLVRGVMPYLDESQRVDAATLARRFATHVDLDAILSAVDAPRPAG
jgi:dethiobiotin synthetase